MKSPALLQHQHSSTSDFVYSCTGQQSISLHFEPGCCCGEPLVTNYQSPALTKGLQLWVIVSLLQRKMKALTEEAHLPKNL